MANFIATSTATDPESEKKTFCKLEGVISLIFFARSVAGLCVRPPNMT